MKKFFQVSLGGKSKTPIKQKAPEQLRLGKTTMPSENTSFNDVFENIHKQLTPKKK